MGCGRVASKPALVRVALTAGQRPAVNHGPAANHVPAADHAANQEARARLTIDAAGRMPGRGAYLCREGASARPRRECLQLAQRRKAFARAFRQPVDVTAELIESIGS